MALALLFSGVEKNRIEVHASRVQIRKSAQGSFTVPI